MEIEILGSVAGEFEALAVCNISQQFYVGPQDFLSSNLFRNNIYFRNEFRLLNLVSRTIITSSVYYQLKKNTQLPHWFPEVKGASPLLCEVMRSVEKSLNGEYEVIRNMINVVNYYEVTTEWVDPGGGGNCTCFLIEAIKKRMFGTPYTSYILETRYHMGKDDPDYEIQHFELPPRMKDLMHPLQGIGTIH